MGFDAQSSMSRSLKTDEIDLSGRDVHRGAVRAEAAANLVELYQIYLHKIYDTIQVRPSFRRSIHFRVESNLLARSLASSAAAQLIGRSANKRLPT